MTDEIVVRPAASWRDRRRFQNLAWSINAGDPNWVPPLRGQERQLLGWGQHPFFDHAEAITFMALRHGRAVGRLAAIVNRAHNRKYNVQTGFFGFFECVDDTKVAGALMNAADGWLRQRGMTSVLGPVNPSLNYTCGLLVDGFDRPPCFQMTYNPPYYAALIESCDFIKAQDLYAYEMRTELLAALTTRYKPAVLASLERTELVIRPLNMKKYEQEIGLYLDIYNRSLEDTWGFTPLQPGEARQIADELRHLIVPDFAVFAEIDGQPVGALLALLDYNQIFRKLNGRLFPFGFVRLLTGRRHIKVARALALTMVPGYQSSGLGIVLLDNLVAAAAKWGIERYEFSWVLESNALSRGSLERAGTRVTNTYRLYDKAL